jgi:transcriptional regulator GlxA family with amidase domain
VLVLPDVQIMDLAGPVQVFFEAQGLGADYETVTCSSVRRVKTGQGQCLSDLQPLPPLRSFLVPASLDLVIVPGLRVTSLQQVGPEVYGWLRAVHAAGAHIASVCTGAFVLGAAGLLEGRRCTTHWSVCQELQRRFPTARVLDDRLFVTDGGVTSSGGLSSGVDMALWFIERDYGPRIAAQTAHQMVVYIRRDAAQTQQSVYLDYRSHLHPGVHRVQDWLADHSSERPSMVRLAAIALMSQRHLTRVFRQATGISIGQYTTRLRLELARSLIHEPTLTIDAVATRCGFTDARHLRRSWRAAFGVSPSQTRAKSEEGQELEGDPLDRLRTKS